MRDSAPSTVYQTNLENGSPVATFSTESTSALTERNAEEVSLEPLNIISREDVPPDGGYGWVITLCVFLINAHTWGVNSAWGIFLSHYLVDGTFPGATTLEYALIGGLSVSQALVVSPIVAISTKRFGTRMSMLIGTALIFIALLGASFSTQIWHLFLSQGFCFGWGMGFLYITASNVLPQWFSSRRSLAVGLASSGAGLGGLAYNLGAGVAADTLGLPWTYRILAFCTLAVNAVCAVLLKDRNMDVKPAHRPFDSKELLRIEVLLVVVWGSATDMGYIALLYSLPHYATSIGLSQKQGSVVGAMLSLGLAVGRPFVGLYSDRFGRINTATVMTALCGFFCLTLWIPAKSYGVLIAFALLAGTVCGTFWATVTPVTAEIVGLKRLPSSFGIVCICLVLPTTFAEPIALQIVSASGYLSSQIFVACMFLLGATATWFLRSWKLFDIEQKAVFERENRRGDQVASLATSIWNRRKDFWLTPRRLIKPQRV